MARSDLLPPPSWYDHQTTDDAVFGPAAAEDNWFPQERRVSPVAALAALRRRKTEQTPEFHARRVAALEVALAAVAEAGAKVRSAGLPALMVRRAA